ncbi:MAG: YihY family inner membrane protein [Muribaculaceae bacterium]|nr:YihY family inner membrane protein [Muribaculaceae bacterium]
MADNETQEKARNTLIGRLTAWWQRTFAYCSEGVWRDTRKSWRVNAVKIANLSVKGFLSSDLQTQACAMTFRMLLAVVPALALILAIATGFGFQNLLKEELYSYLPSQHTALEAAFNFVDSYLNQASEGMFVGVGIVFLLTTLISLLMSVEDVFNTIWHVEGRSIWRKITDYIAILLVLPVLLICSAGLSLLMSTTLRSLFDIAFLRPAVDWLIDLGSLVFTALFFTGAYLLIPNTKVKFLNAFITGCCVAIAFQVLQWLFVTGQLYVTRYNAIYGSFSFLPLLLIWSQLVCLFTLIGALLCYASQNAAQYNFHIDVEKISMDYNRKVTLAVMALIAKRFAQGKEPLTASILSKKYQLPASLVTKIVLRLRDAKLVNFLEHPGDFGEHPLQPALDVSSLTCGEIIRRLQTLGSSGFIPDFETNFKAAEDVASQITDAMIDTADNTNIVSLNINI